MVKLIIGIGVILFSAGIWIRSQWGRSKNNSTAKQIIDDLKSGKYVIESYAESLGILICTKVLPKEADLKQMKTKLQAFIGKQLLSKYKIEYADLNDNGNGIIIAEAKGKELVPVYGGNKEIEIHFPCWLYIQADQDNARIEFKSTFPESKDHHYLLEDLAAEIYKQFTAGN